MTQPATTYVNPESIRPGYGWQPQGGLAGMLYARDRARYENLAGMQDEMMGAQRDLTLEDLVQGAPARQATRDATVKDLPMRSRQLEAQTVPMELESQFQQRMAPGRQELGLGQQGLDRGQQSIARTVQAIAQVPPGPDYVARMGQILQQSGIDPNQEPMRSILSGSTPQDVQKRANAFVQNQNWVNPQYQQNLGIGAQRGEYDLERQRIANRGAVAAANARTSAKNKTAAQLLREAKSPIELITRASVVLSDPEMDSRTVETARKAVMSNWEAYSTLVQKGQIPPIPGFPAVRPLQNPYGPGGQQQQGPVKWGRDAKGNPIRLGQ